MIKYEINMDNSEALCFEIDETAPSEFEQLKRKIPSEIEKSSYPEWTHLDYVKCSACPLDSSRSTYEKYCPAAIALSELIPLFSKVKSTEVATVRVYTNSKVIEKRVDVRKRFINHLYYIT